MAHDGFVDVSIASSARRSSTRDSIVELTHEVPRARHAVDGDARGVRRARVIFPLSCVAVVAAQAALARAHGTGAPSAGALRDVRRAARDARGRSPRSAAAARVGAPMDSSGDAT